MTHKNISSPMIVLVAIAFSMSAFGCGQDVSLPNSARSANIIVSSPTPNQTVNNPFVLMGSAREFENALNYQLMDENGAVLKEDYTMASSSDAGQFGPFRVEISYPATHGTHGTLNVFAYSAKDGSIIDLVSVPVVLKP